MRYLAEGVLRGSGFLLITLTFILNNSVSIAQTVNDIENAVTQGAQFDDAQNLSNRHQQSLEGSVIEGEPGVFILRKIDIFSVGALVGGGYSSNPNRNFDTNGDGSIFASVAVTAGVNTRIGSKYDAGVNFVLSAIEYERENAPSNRNVVGNAYIGKSFLKDRLYISASLSSGISMDGNFKQGTMFYRTSLSASTAFPLSKRIILRPGVSIARQWSGQKEQNNISATISGELLWRLNPKWRASGLVSYTHRRYDNFFEDVTFVKRKDNLIRLSLSVVRHITRSVDISASLEYAHQGSKFFLSAYDTLDSGIYGRLTHRF